MKKLNKKGFTLAELLIVIAIIAILIAIAIPVFGGQLENARLQTDHANIRSAYALAQTATIQGGIYIGADGTDYKPASEETSDTKYVFCSDGSVCEGMPATGDNRAAYTLKASVDDDDMKEKCGSSAVCLSSTDSNHQAGHIIVIVLDQDAATYSVDISGTTVS